jgi:DNA polymerase/3'-5' exonuclease PolX
MLSASMESLATSMNLDPHRIAAQLREIAAYLWLDGESFRARAYQRAATVVESVPEFERVVAEGRLTSLPRIGTGISAAIVSLVETGTTKLFEELKGRWPAEKVAKNEARRARGRGGAPRPTMPDGGPALLLPQARELTESLVQHLAACAAAVRAETAGDVRRWQEMPAHLDVAVAIAPGATEAVREHM